MDWYFGSSVDELVVPKDHELSDRFPSPENWPNWEISESERFEFPNKGFVIDAKMTQEELNFNSDILSNEIEMESSIHDNDQYSPSIGGGTSDESLHQTAFSCGQLDYQLDSLAGFEQMDDLFLSSIIEAPSRTENLRNSFCFEPEFQNYMAPLVKVLVPSEHNQMNENVDEETSLEESVLQEMELVMAQLTDRTRICFRDALYRLAKNSRQQVVTQNQNGNLSVETSPCTGQEEKMRPEGGKSTELETNTIDRAIANLMFNKMGLNVHDFTVSASASSKTEADRQTNYSLNQPQIHSLPHYPIFSRDVEVPILCQGSRK